MTSKSTTPASPDLVQTPEEVIYRACYSPVPLDQLLASAESRSKIRRLSPVQIFFGIRELDDETIQQLLPHITEEQWTAVLDLDLWSRDRFRIGPFLGWTRHLTGTEPAVARKLLRATGEQLWMLAFGKALRIYSKVEQDEFEGDAGEGEESFITPDGAFLVVLPRHADKARLFFQLIRNLYAIDAEAAAYWLNSARFQTPSELEETAYRQRTDRIEELGFQNYYDALSIYTPLPLKSRLPRKQASAAVETTLPATAPQAAAPERGLLLFQAMAAAEKTARNALELVQELSFVCNQLLGADRVTSSTTRNIKRGIRKAVTGINLGLDCWSEGDLLRATAGLQQHPLSAFFQIGHAQLLELRQIADRVIQAEPPPRGSFREAVIEGFRLPYPMQTVLQSGRPRRRFIDSQAQWNEAVRVLERRFDGRPEAG